MKIHRKIFFAAAGLGLIFQSVVSSVAATATVLVGSGGLVFVPATTNINTGDQVIWSWAGSFHSTTSGTNGAASGLWDSGVNNVPHSFTNTFNTAGNYSYYCSVHFSSGMKGNIIVAAPNIPPAVTITNPISGAILSAPANVTIQATASDSDGSVTNVQFRIGSTILTNKIAAPFSAATNNLPAGNYTLTAIASDNLGATATNAISINVVTPVQTILSAPQFLNSTSFQFSYAANTGLNYVVQMSSNLAPANWITLATNTAASNPVIFVDNQATNNPGFYRVGRLPNP